MTYKLSTYTPVVGERVRIRTDLSAAEADNIPAGFNYEMASVRGQVFTIKIVGRLNNTEIMSSDESIPTQSLIFRAMPKPASGWNWNTAMVEPVAVWCPVQGPGVASCCV
jgi:hypothetical protein